MSHTGLITRTCSSGNFSSASIHPTILSPFCLYLLLPPGLIRLVVNCAHKSETNDLWGCMAWRTETSPNTETCVVKSQGKSNPPLFWEIPEIKDNSPTFFTPFFKILTLCAFKYCPSTANVTSVKVSACNSWSKTDSMFVWWLFHRKQNRCDAILSVFACVSRPSWSISLSLSLVHRVHLAHCRDQCGLLVNNSLWLFKLFFSLHHTNTFAMTK